MTFKPRFEVVDADDVTLKGLVPMVAIHTGGGQIRVMPMTTLEILYKHVPEPQPSE